jgi:peptide/nickel transport system ATP-binding protein
LITLDAVRAGYATPAGFVAAVDGISLTVGDDEILGIAGESGCGKSTLVRLIYGDFGAPAPLRLAAGRIDGRFVDTRTGKDITLVGAELRRHWWDLLSYVPQGSMGVLNPVARIGAQFSDALPARRSGRDVDAEIVAFLGEFDLDAGVLRAYPHQLSGGMRQRVLVAMAAFVQPRVILADEPTTALDVVVQKRILILLRTVQRRQRNSVVIVSHDLGVHYQIADRLAVLYAGKLVEIGTTDQVFAAPSHPYTRGLIEAIPRIGDLQLRGGIEGRPPDLAAPPPGCRFHPRCPEAREICARTEPALEEKAPGQFAACHFR